MKTKNIYSITVCLFSMILLFTHCEKEIKDDIEPNNNNENIYRSGVVDLPEGINSKDLKIVSVFESKDLDNSSYSINDVLENNSLVFIKNSAGKVVLMRYNYPGQPNQDISVESTLTALIMSLPFTSMLNSEVKKDLIKTLESSHNHKTLSNELSEYIKQGLSPFEILDSTFLMNISSLVKETATRLKAGNIEYDKNPVNVIKTSNEIVFQNTGKLYSSQIAIYKDNVALKNIKLDRIKFFSTSVSEALQSGANYVFKNLEGIEIVEESFNWEEYGDGEYKIKISNGFGTD